VPAAFVPSFYIDVGILEGSAGIGCPDFLNSSLNFFDTLQSAPYRSRFSA
jgi:hypothetical protein